MSCCYSHIRIAVEFILLLLLLSLHRRVVRHFDDVSHSLIYKLVSLGTSVARNDLNQGVGA